MSVIVQNDNHVIFSFRVLDQNDVVVNLTDATVTMIINRAGERITRNVSIDVPEEGKCFVVLLQDLLSEGGIMYDWQLKVELPQGEIHGTKIDRFYVERAL